MDITRCPVTLDELELDGLSGTLTTLDQIIALVREIPFEAGMTHLAPIAADVYHHPFDRDQQLKLARRVWRPQLAEPIADVVSASRSRLVFDERYITILQRLLIEHADDSDAAMTDEQQTLLTVLLLAVPVALDDDAPPVADPDRPSRDERDAWTYFTLQSGVYAERVDPMQAIARSRGLYIDALQDPTLSIEIARCPFDDWMREDHEGAGLADQLAGGLALAAASGALDDDLSLEDRLTRHLGEGFLAQSNVSDEEARTLRSVSATRDELREAFAKEGTTPQHVAWDRVVFEQHPFLRTANGRLQLISPRALVSWFTDGLYYRGLDAANRRRHPNPSKAAAGKTLVHGYTSLIGRASEVYVRRVARQAHARPIEAGAVEVLPEREYRVGNNRKDSSDLYVVQPPEITAVEIYSGRLPRTARISADPEDMERATTKMVVDKLNELHRAIKDVLDGHVAIPGLEMTPVKRIWPVVLLTGHGLLTTPILWGLVRDQLAPGAFSDPRVGPPTLCDLDDFELLLGLVEKGETLPALLCRFHASPFAEMPPRNWLSDQFPGRVPRPSFVEEGSRQVFDDVQAKFFGTRADTADAGD